MNGIHLTERSFLSQRLASQSACALLLAALGTAACERNDTPEDAAPLLTLRVETPEALDWGGSGVLRLTLTNEGEEPAVGGIVQVFVPDWLEFGSVEPPGTAVTVVSGDAETSLQYQLTDSLAPGDSRVIVQHLRVLERPVPPSVTDTVETVQIAPTNQRVRARLLTASGEAIGVEVQADLNFVGWTGPVPPRGDTVRDTLAPGSDTLPGPRDTLPPDTLPPDTLPPGALLPGTTPPHMALPGGTTPPGRTRSPRPQGTAPSGELHGPM